MSVPSAAGAKPRATAAADPPELPPGTRAEIPRIAHRPEVRGFAGRAHGKLVHIGLAENDRAGAVSCSTTCAS